jgi:hypothetical protein
MLLGAPSGVPRRAMFSADIVALVSHLDAQKRPSEDFGLEDSAVVSRMALSGRFGWLLLGALAAGCSNQVEQEPTKGLDTQMGNRTSGGTTGGSSGGSGVTDACTTAASWQAHDLEFDAAESPRDFAEALNPLLHAQTSPAIAVTNYMAPHCVWMVAFSATDGTSDAAEHAATTEMFRHPRACGRLPADDRLDPRGRCRSANGMDPDHNVTGSPPAFDCSSLESPKRRR